MTTRYVSPSALSITFAEHAERHLGWPRVVASAEHPGCMYMTKLFPIDSARPHLRRQVQIWQKDGKIVRAVLGVHVVLPAEGHPYCDVVFDDADAMLNFLLTLERMEAL